MIDREVPELHLVLARLFGRYLGAGGPNVDVYGNVLPGCEKEPMEMIAMQLMEINTNLDRIATALESKE